MNEPGFRTVESPEERSQKERMAVYWLSGLLTLGLLVSYMLPTLQRVLGEPVHFWGDDALIEIATISASHGQRLLGPYSRFQWNHPGPACFYLFAPLYRLSGQNPAMLVITAVLINLLAVVAVVVAVYRKTRPDMPLASFYGPLALLAACNGAWSAAIWNPYLILWPFFLLIVLCATLAAGSIALLPVVVLLGSFIAQTHLGPVPTVGAVILVSFGFFLLLRYGPKRMGGSLERDKSAPRTWPWIVLGALVLFFFWLPPLVEELCYDRGNLTRLLTFFREQTFTRDLSDTLHLVSRQILAPFERLTPQDLKRSAAKAIVVAGAILATPAVWIGFRRNRRFHAALCLVSVAGFLAALWSVGHVVGEPLPYITAWMQCLGVIAVTGMTGVYLPRVQWPRGTWKRRAYGMGQAGMLLLCFSVAVASAVNVNREGRMGTQPPDEDLIPRASRRILEYLRERDARACSCTTDARVWPFSAAIILQLYKNGIDCRVDEEEVFRYGHAFAPGSTRPRLEITFRDGPQQPQNGLALLIQGKVVYETVYVYAKEPDDTDR